VRTEGVTLALGSIAANVRRLRLRRGLTQEQLAELAGLETRTVQHLETGNANPTAAVLVVIADALGVSPGSLFRRAAIETRPVGRPKRPRRRGPARR
jgi:transcriptional regulator with XRE-family HTH domain